MNGPFGPSSNASLYGLGVWGDNPRSLAIEYFRPVQVKRYVFKKTRFPCGRNAYFGIGVFRSRTWRPKKNLKNIRFFNVFLRLQNLDDRTGLEEAMKNAKQQFRLTNRKVLMQKARKLNTFHYFLGHCLGPDLPSYLPYGGWSVVFFSSENGFQSNQSGP
jgi:hypothetical protein